MQIDVVRTALPLKYPTITLGQSTKVCKSKVLRRISSFV